MRRWQPRRRAARAGSSLIEFALVMPVLVAITLGGISLYMRVLYRDSLETMAELAAASIARTGQTAGTIQYARERAAPFIPLTDLCYRIAGSDFHGTITVDLFYNGDAIATLPFFNDPLAPTGSPAVSASAINQMDRMITSTTAVCP